MSSPKIFLLTHGELLSDNDPAHTEDGKLAVQQAVMSFPKSRYPHLICKGTANRHRHMDEWARPALTLSVHVHTNALLGSDMDQPSDAASSLHNWIKMLPENTILCCDPETVTAIAEQSALDCIGELAALYAIVVHNGVHEILKISPCSSGK